MAAACRIDIDPAYCEAIRMVHEVGYMFVAPKD
jgi:hypothetical protein